MVTFRTPSRSNRTKCALSRSAPAKPSRAPRAGQLLVTDRARQWRQVRIRFRLELRRPISPHWKSRTKTSRRISPRICTLTMLGDFPQVWIGSWAGGRTKPLVIYGPTGPEPRYGTKHFVEHQMKAFAWDTATRLGLLPDAGAEVEVHEFDLHQDGRLRKERRHDQSFPAVHIYDGLVSLRLEWNGLSFVFSGDTTPSQFFVDNAKNADLVIHEAFNTVSQLMDRSAMTSAPRAASAPWRILRRTKPAMCSTRCSRGSACCIISSTISTPCSKWNARSASTEGDAGAGAGSDGVQRHQGRDPGAPCRNARSCLAEQGAP